MARSAPKKLTAANKKKLMDPKIAIVLHALKKQKPSTR
jgi:hypothetical protein